MAEQRFPSIEDFSEDTPIPSRPAGSSSTTTNQQSFLDRERAALGDDADFFSNPNDNKIASVEEEEEDYDDDLLGGGGSGGNVAPASAGGNAEDLDFESSFPAIDTRNEAVGPGGTVTGINNASTASQGFSQQAYSSYNPSSITSEPEPEVIKQWRDRRTLALNHRSTVASEKKSKTIATAHANIDEFYESYNNKKDKSIAQSRKDAELFLAGRDDTTAGGTSWDRICRLVDLSAKGAASGSAGSGSGKEKFRELLVSLRKDDKAPGASGGV